MTSRQTYIISRWKYSESEKDFQIRVEGELNVANRTLATLENTLLRGNYVRAENIYQIICMNYEKIYSRYTGRALSDEACLYDSERKPSEVERLSYRQMYIWILTIRTATSLLAKHGHPSYSRTQSKTETKREVIGITRLPAMRCKPVRSAKSMVPPTLTGTTRLIEPVALPSID